MISNPNLIDPSRLQVNGVLHQRANTLEASWINATPQQGVIQPIAIGGRTRLEHASLEILTTLLGKVPDELAADSIANPQLLAETAVEMAEALLQAVQRKEGANQDENGETSPGAPDQNGAAS